MTKHKLIKTSVLAWLGIAALFTAPIGLAQTCNLVTTPNAPDHRYQVNLDSTVTDLNTNLMWRQCAEGTSGADCSVGLVELFDWIGALDRVAAINSTGGFAGYTDWRLPNIKELRSLRSMRCTEPAINAVAFPNTPKGWYWSSSPSAHEPMFSWYVDFSFGFSHGYSRDASFLRIRLVRDAP